MLSALPFATAAPPERFEREYGYTDTDWRRCLPEAAGAGVAIEWQSDGAAWPVGARGRLTLHWHVLPERRIALVRLPRLAVLFGFDGCDPTERQACLHRFDRAMQRGGG